MKCNFKNQYDVVLTDTKIKSNIRRIVDDNGYDDSIKDLLSKAYDYMIYKNLSGGCHALSSVLYIAFSELGYNPILYIGECERKGIKPFDHSWITVNDKVVDLAIYWSWSSYQKGIVSGPVVFNIDCSLMKEHEIYYGINTGLPFSTQTERVLESSFVKYMNQFPFEPNGLWSVLCKVCPSIKYSTELVDKYSNTERVLVR